MRHDHDVNEIRRQILAAEEKKRRQKGRKDHCGVREKLLNEACPDCGGRMFSGNDVIVYCEEAWYNPNSNCQNILASG